MAKSKILTWISSQKSDINITNGNEFTISVKPFKLDFSEKSSGEIRQIKFKNNAENIDSFRNLAPDITQSNSWSHGRLLLEIKYNWIKIENNQTLVVQNREEHKEWKVSAQSWNWPSDFRFTLTGVEDSDTYRYGSGSKELILKIQEQNIEPAAFSPLIKSVIVYCGQGFGGEEKRDALKRQLEVDKEYSINISASSAEMITENRLDLKNEDWKIPTFSKIGSDSQPIQETDETQKIWNAYNKMNSAYENRHTNLEEAILALKSLLELKEKGDYWQKKKFEKIVGSHELEKWEKELVHNSYKQGRTEIPNWNKQKESEIRSKIRKTINNAYITKDTSNDLAEVKNAITELENIKKSNGSEDWELSEFNNWGGEVCLNELKAKQKSLENPTQKPTSDSNGNSNPNSPKPNLGAEDKNNFIKIETEARQKIKDQSEKFASELTRLLSEATDKNDYEELGAIIQKIDKYSGEEEYQINHKVEIQALKNHWGNLNKAKHKEKVAQKTKKTLESAGVKKGELDSETQQLITQLENGEIIEVNDINQAEDKIIANVGKRKEETSLEKWLRKAKEISEKLKQKVVNDLKEIKKEAEEVVKNLTHFAASSNVFQQEVYLGKKSEVEKSLKELKALDFTERKKERKRIFLKTNFNSWRNIRNHHLSRFID